MMDKQDAKNLKIYFLITYLVFWVLLALTGLMISLNVPLLMQTIMKNLSAWAPTFAILILFKKLYPDFTFKEYMKLHFIQKVKPRVFLVSVLLQVSILVTVVLAFFMMNRKPLNSMTFISISTIIPVIIIDLTSGPLGEELGWRGYALNLLQKKYVPLKAGIIVGVVWGFWHLPLMFLSGYTGLASATRQCRRPARRSRRRPAESS